jgi:hypothetical protein
MTLAFLLCTSAGLLFAQAPFDEIRADRGKAGGIYSMYRFGTPARTLPPKGYRPFYISHYGRHGARMILTDDQFSRPFEVLRRAAEDSALTETGIELFNSMQRMAPDMDYRAGDLTSKGAWQHKMLAGRMFKAYPSIFRHNPHVRAEATTVDRCEMSMAAFCTELTRLDPGIDLTMEVSRAFMPYLNAYAADNPKAMKSDLVFKSDKASWYPDYLEFRSKKIDEGPFTARIFKDTSMAGTYCDPEQFENDIYYLAVDLPCTDFNDISFIDLFTDDELCRLWECDNYTFYVQKGPDPRNEGRSKELSSNLLREMISSADSDLVSGNPNVRLRFGHDGCLMGLLSLMNVDGWNTPVNDPDSIKYVWQTYRIPMASNLQFIFYRNRRKPDDILVKMLLNEDETQLPFESDFKPYYHWADFKRYYNGILSQYEQ